jgi:NADPH:quinone reductase-like Zn-dependent oxidoreductase
LTFEQAAAVPLNGLAALNLLRKGDIQADQEVLIYGASGGVGIFAVQIANHHGAKVTGVCSGYNLEKVKDMGAEQALDYTREDVLKRPGRYDLIFDAAGKLIHGRSKGEFKRILKPGGKFVDIEMSRKDRAEDLDTLRQLVEAGELMPILDRSFPLEQVAAAHRYVEDRHTMGAVVLLVASD